MLGDPSPVQADVKEGESLSLRAEFDAYPEPNDLSWSYDGKRLLNTTEHVITVHRHKYRYGRVMGRRARACGARTLTTQALSLSGTSASSGW